jgi:hypothetical protein
MLTTCEDALSASHADALAPEHASQLLVFYTHHRPQYAERDMGFFDKARARGWVCDEIVTETYAVRSMCASEQGRVADAECARSRCSPTTRARRTCAQPCTDGG